MKKTTTALLLAGILVVLASGCSDRQENSDQSMDQSNIATITPEFNQETSFKRSFEDALESIAIPNADNIKGNITLCNHIDIDDQSYPVVWRSSDESKVTSTAGLNGQIPAGVVTRGEQDSIVTLTAVISSDDIKVSKDYILTIKAKPKTPDYSAYLYCYFQDNIYGKGQTQQIFFATSTDGLRWKSLNQDQPVLISDSGTKGVRDPFLLRSNEGDKFYLIATDLDANGGDWGAYSTNGSRNIVIWESDDLVHWSEERLVDISPRNAECMWAPEAYYDDTTGEYIVYWSASVKGGNGKKIYYARTRDFYTFSQPKIFKYVERNSQSLKNSNGKIESSLTYIDTTVLRVNDRFYRFTKREIDQSILMEVSDELLGSYSVVEDIIGGEKGVEGPSVFQLIDQEKWIMMVDGYTGKGYFPMIADGVSELEKGHFLRLPQIQYQMPKGARHGSFMTITADEYDSLKLQWGQ